MTKVSIKSLIFGLVFILLIAAVAVLGVKLNDSVTTKTVGSFAFKVGGLDEDGVEIKSDNTIVTRDYISAEGLKIEMKSEKVRYKIAFYDRKKKLVGEVSDFYVTDYEATDLAADIVYAKVVVEALSDAEINFLEVRKYASMLEITVNR